MSCKQINCGYNTRVMYNDKKTNKDFLKDYPSLFFIGYEWKEKVHKHFVQKS